MSEKRFEIFPQNVTKDGTLIIIQKGLKLYNISDVVELLNALYEENEQLKNRVYDFEKRKIIEESEIDEDVIPKIKLLRAELFGEKYE